MAHGAAALIVLVYSALLLFGGVIGLALTPTMVEWMPMVLPYSKIVQLIPMALALSLATNIVRRMFPCSEMS